MAEVAGPLVVACVDPQDLRPDVDPLTGEVTYDPRRADLSAADAAALEHALRVAEAWGGRVLVVAAGPPEIDPVLREAASLGADAMRVTWPSEYDGHTLAGDAAALAAALVGAIRTEAEPALVVCGDRSPGRGTGAVPAYIAHLLRAEQALGLVSLMAVPADGEPAVGELEAERRLDAGWRERLRVRAPAVCSVEAAGVRLRRAPLSAALEVTRRAIPVVRASEPVGGGSVPPALSVGAPTPYRPRTRLVPAPKGGTRQRLLALTGALATHEPPRIVGPVNASAAADELLAYLQRHGYGTARPGVH